MRNAGTPQGKLPGLIEPPWALGAYRAAISAVTALDRDHLVIGTGRIVRIHVSERPLDPISVRFQRHYLLSLEERLGVHLSAVDSDHDP